MTVARARRNCLLGLLLLGCTVTGRASAQTGSVSGVVRTEGRPLPLARVDALLADTVRGQTNASENGRYRLVLAPGTYTIRFRLPGYAERRVDGVQVQSGGSSAVDADLVRHPVVLDHIVVTAGRREERAADALASVAAVDESTIRDRVSTTRLDHAIATPGVDVAVQGLQGRQLVARGFNATLSASLLMLTDHRNAALPAPRANLSYFLAQGADDIERVEIVRGPASALWGPNAADGVVHFITKSPFDSPGTTLSVTAGDRSLFEGSGRIARRVNDQFAFKLSGSYFRGREWRAPLNPAETIARDPITERAGGELRADYRFSPTASAILTIGTAEAIRVADHTAIGVYQVKNWRTDFAQLRYEDGATFAQVYLNANPGGGTSTSLQQGAVTLDHTNILAAQVQRTADLGARTAMTYGVDVQRTDPQTLGTINGRNEDDDRLLEGGVYAQATTRLTTGWRLLTAARLDRHNRLEGVIFSPRVGVSYSPREGQSLRVSYNRAYSTPGSLQLSGDILAARLDPLPFSMRAVGVPKDGFRFARDCGGLCMSSPFAPGQPLPLDATTLWPAVVQIMRGAGVDLSGLPAPTGADVATALRILDLSAGAFRAYSGDVNDLAPLEPTITNSFEAGYRTLVGERVLIDGSVYHTRRQNFISPLTLVTPNVFLSTASLATYFRRFMNAAQADALAAGIGGVDGNAAAPGIPLATVGPSGSLGGSDLLLTYRNVGDVRLWGTDLSAELAATDRLTVSAAYSWVSRNFFAGKNPGDLDFSTNAPRNKLSAAVRYSRSTDDLSAEVRARHVGGFRMVDGILIGDVERFTVADVEVSRAVPAARGARVTLSVQNVANARHAEFFAHPVLGRLAMARLVYRF